MQKFESFHHMVAKHGMDAIFAFLKGRKISFSDGREFFEFDGPQPVSRITIEQSVLNKGYRISKIPRLEIDTFGLITLRSLAEMKEFRSSDLSDGIGIHYEIRDIGGSALQHNQCFLTGHLTIYYHMNGIVKVTCTEVANARCRMDDYMAIMVEKTRYKELV